MLFFSANAADEAPQLAEIEPCTENFNPPPMPTSSQPLGYPMPRDEHACSVSLPTWSSVVGYEEGSPAVTSAKLCGYPRFVYHPYVLQLKSTVVLTHGLEGRPEDCLVLTTEEAAIRCQVFLQQAWEGQSATSASKATSSLPDNALVKSTDDVALPHLRIRRVEVVPDLVSAVFFPAETEPGMAAKAYWQHTGEIVSSRRASNALRQLGFDLDKTVTQEEHVCHQAHLDTEDDLKSASRTQSFIQYQLRESIAQWASVSAESVILRAIRESCANNGRYLPPKACLWHLFAVY
jgi:cystathionine gamma-synthase